MDANEVKRLYYIMLVDVREEERNSAAEKLLSSDDERIGILAAIAKDTSKVLNDNADASILSETLKAFDNFPVNEFWRSFMEVTGEVLLRKATQSPKNKKKLLKHAFAVISRSLDGGFTISDSTARLMEAVKDEKTGMASLILEKNSRNRMPSLPRTLKSDKLKKEKSGRRPTSAR